jgi:hypothetical protein
LISPSALSLLSTITAKRVMIKALEAIVSKKIIPPKLFLQKFQAYK